MTGPAWLGIGAQRCGTTWFVSLLTQHPRMDVADGVKEHHWLYRYGLTRRWDEAAQGEYTKKFASDDVMLGEFTPYYVRASWMVDIVAEVVPEEAPIIVLVRDPIDRFASALRHAMRATRLRYETAMGQRKRNRTPGKGPAGKGAAKDPSRAHRHPDQVGSSATRVVVHGPPRPPEQAVINRTWLRYVGSDVSWGGMYAAQLDAWTAVIPKDRFVVIQYEKLANGPQHFAEMVWKRLGLDPITLVDARDKRSRDRLTWVPDDYPEVVRSLQRIYRPDAERLARQFDIDLALWERTMA